MTAVSAGLVSTAAASSSAPSWHVLEPAATWTSHVGIQPHALAPAQVSATVWLSVRDAAGLRSLATAVSDPKSSSYGHYLTSQQFTARFAPTQAQVSAVRSWLTGAGLSVMQVGPQNRYVAVRGPLSAIDAAFATTVGQFSVHGRQVLGPTTPVNVPAGLATSVSGVTGLDTLGSIAHPNIVGGGTDSTTNPFLGTPSSQPPPPAGFVNAPPCSTFYREKLDLTNPAVQGQHLPYAPCGYVPAQLRGAYDVSRTGLTGKGVTVAITDAYSSPTLGSDANRYATRRGDHAFRPGQFQVRSTAGDPATFTACDASGWYGEQSLDVEAVHGIAPDARVLYYGAASCFDNDLLTVLARVVADNQASIVSNSWGEPTFIKLDDGTIVPTQDESSLSAYEAIFQQGAAQGIGFYFSSGDNGDELATYGVKAPDYPAADPWVTAVGGTSLAVTAARTRLFETGWGTDKYVLSSSGKSWVSQGFLYGAGGGYSKLFPRPKYQFGIARGTGRAVPDIAAVGDPNTGMLIGLTQDFGAARTRFGSGVQYGEYRIGGTSLASPLTAGIQAVAQQGRSRIGFANPLIYSLSWSHVYFDVTPQGDPGVVRVDYVNGLNADQGTKVSLRTFDTDSSLTTNPGWDDVTGVGSPRLRYILAVHAKR